MRVESENSLTLIRIPYEEPYHLNLAIKVSNGRQSGELEFYTSVASLVDCAEALQRFPQNARDEFVWSLGSEDVNDRFSFFVRLHLQLANSGAGAAINLRLINNVEPSKGQSTDIPMPCEIAGINLLGSLVKRFSKFEGEILRWNGLTGEII